MATKLNLKSKSAEKPAGEKEAAKAERQALIAAEVEVMVPQIKEYISLDDKAKGKFFTLITSTREWVKENEASKAETLDMLRIAFAEVGEFDAKELTGSDGMILHPTEAQNISSLLNTVHPAKAEFAKALDKAIADKKSGKKAYSNAAIRHTAKTGEAPQEKSRGRKTGSASTNDTATQPKAKGFDTLEDYKMALAGLLALCEKAEFEDDEVEEATDEQVADWMSRPKEEADKDEDEE